MTDLELFDKPEAQDVFFPPNNDDDEFLCSVSVDPGMDGEELLNFAKHALEMRWPIYCTHKQFEQVAHLYETGIHRDS